MVGKIGSEKTLSDLSGGYGDKLMDLIGILLTRYLDIMLAISRTFTFFLFSIYLARLERNRKRWIECLRSEEK